ncbi:Double-stranded RNA-specific editase 1 [Ilyodon furcidens]|uniref:Double-stranded RNA-specific editase 1 n=1 Tax=Ilyodon furcidens TaxID=33524 RepID=A0ABV0UYQ3_9TELE
MRQTNAPGLNSRSGLLQNGQLASAPEPVRIVAQSGCCMCTNNHFLSSYPFDSLSGISNTEARQPGKAPSFSVNWTVGDQGLEVINGYTGKDDLGRPSRLCKHALYTRWMDLHSKLSSTLLIQTVQPRSYHEAKQTAVEYHLAKQALFRVFHKAGLGAWVKKPVEQDQFSLNN